MPASTPDGRRTVRRGATVALTIFTGFGLLLAAVIAIDWLQGVRTHLWEEVICTIESSDFEAREEYGDYVFRVTYRYEYRWEPYRGDRYRHEYGGSDDVFDAQRLVARYSVGSSVPCWVDPNEPGSSYLRQAGLLRGLWIFVPLLVVTIGGGALWALHGPSPAGPDAPASRGVITASPLTTAAGLTLFFGLFFIVGAGLLIPFFVWPAYQVVRARTWTPVECEILESGIASHSGDDGTTYSVEVLYRYRVGGRDILGNRYQFLGGSSSGYDAKAAAVEQIPAGATATCYVDPDDPFDAVVDRGFSRDFFFGLIPALFMLVGTGGMTFAIVTVRAVAKDTAAPSWTPSAGVVTAPQTAGMTDEAWTSGPVVLASVRGRLGGLAGVLAVALFWNGIVALFLWPLVESWRTGNPDWVLAVFLFPFVVVGLLLLASIPYSVLALLNPRPRVRLSSGALRAGKSAMIEWTFDGAASRLRNLRIWLESSRGTHQVTGGPGTTGGADGRPIDSIDILDRAAGQSIEFGTVSFTVPADANPSADGAHAIRWVLRLHGQIDFWPDVDESYEIRVLPASAFGR